MSLLHKNRGNNSRVTIHIRSKLEHSPLKLLLSKSAQSILSVTQVHLIELEHGGIGSIFSSDIAQSEKQVYSRISAHKINLIIFKGSAQIRSD